MCLNSEYELISKSQEALKWELNLSNGSIERLQEQLKEESEIESASLKSQLASMNLNEVLHDLKQIA